MRRELVAYGLTKAQFFSEFDHFVEYLSTAGLRECDALFGPAWGNHYYPEGGPWLPVRLPLRGLEEETRKAGSLGWGGLGENNLTVTVPGVAPEFFFGNDADIRARFDEPDELTKYFARRWTDRGFQPFEIDIDAGGRAWSGLDLGSLLPKALEALRDEVTRADTKPPEPSP